MDTLIAYSVAVLATTHLLAMIFFVVVLLQIRKSAQAVEVLAYRTQEQIEKLNATTEKVRDFATSVQSGWLKILTVGVGALVAVWPKISRKNSCCSETTEKSKTS
ncbi:MAG: hypothetical protein V3S11_00315 [Elusimicrobiota bacterium]